MITLNKILLLTYLVLLSTMISSLVLLNPRAMLRIRFANVRALTMSSSPTTAASSSSSDTKRIVFLGTPEVAAESLDMLLTEKQRHGYDIVAVVSQPPSASGRNRKLVPSPVHMLAESKGLTILTPEKAGEASFLETLTSLKPDLCITAAYGNFLPSKFLAIPKFGTLNIHPSLLPKYRGAAPVPRCIENGDSKTGVCVLFTVLKMDAGPVVKMVEKTLSGDEKSSQILSEMFQVGTKELISALPSLWDGTIKKVEQDESDATHAPKMNSTEARVDFDTMTAASIHNKCRAFDMWPGIWSLFSTNETQEPSRIKIITTKVLAPPSTQQALTREVEYITQGKTGFFKVVCADGSVLGILELQPPGKKPMDAKAFQNGIKGLNQKLKWVPTPLTIDEKNVSE